MTSSSRQEGDQEGNVPAPAPSPQTEEQGWRTQTPQSTRLMREQERIGVSNLPSRCSSWTHLTWRTVCPIVCGTGGMMMICGDGKLIDGVGTNQLPAVLRINRILTGTSGVAGMPAMTGIGGHLGPPEVMMKRWSSWSPWSHTSVADAEPGGRTTPRVDTCKNFKLRPLGQQRFDASIQQAACPPVPAFAPQARSLAADDAESTGAILTTHDSSLATRPANPQQVPSRQNDYTRNSK